jgi:fatty-acyl-CoA synthase
VGSCTTAAPAPDKVRDGIFWTGDLGYLDDDDFVYFVGRNADWMRVDGENIAAVTIESVVARFPGAGVVAAYAVPDPDVGDQVMVAMLMAEGASFDPGSFGRFLDEQPDLGSKAVPRFVRIVSALPVTASNKVLYRELRCDFWECPDQVWWRDGEGYRLLSDADIDDLRQRFVVRDRSHLLGAG